MIRIDHAPPRLRVLPFRPGEGMDAVAAESQRHAVEAPEVPIPLNAVPILTVPTRNSVTKQALVELAEESRAGTTFTPRQTAVLLLMVRRAYDRGYEAGHFDAGL